MMLKKDNQIVGTISRKTSGGRWAGYVKSLRVLLMPVLCMVVDRWVHFLDQ